MRKFILYVLVLVLVATIGCETKAVEKTKKGYLVLGNSYYRSGEYEKAIELYNKAIGLDPKYAKAYNDRGIAYGEGKRQFDKAIADYNKAIEINPKYAKAYNNRGIIYKREGQYDKAIADYTKVIEINPEYAKAYYNRGLAYGEGKRQFDKAIADYNKAIEINPIYASAYYKRGNDYFNLGKKDRACDDWRQACELGFCKGLDWAEEEGTCQ